MLQAVKRKERYVRANDATLLPIDRTVGNLLEWMPMFLGFFWMSMAVTGDVTVLHSVTCMLRSSALRSRRLAVSVAEFFLLITHLDQPHTSCGADAVQLSMYVLRFVKQQQTA
jgi:hypothetical protein